MAFSPKAQFNPAASRDSANAPGGRVPPEITKALELCVKGSGASVAPFCTLHRVKLSFIHANGNLHPGC
jgi:hypothetical protein